MDLNFISMFFPFLVKRSDSSKIFMEGSGSSRASLIEQPVFEEALRVMSFNICCEDNLEYDWQKRKQNVSSVIRFHKADLAGLQEPSETQIGDLANFLPEFNIFYGLCLKGENTSNHDPILFRKSRFDLLDSGFFFLSLTPEKLSKGWGAKFPRGTSWVKLFDKRTKKNFYFFNTHFDYHSKSARDESAKLLRQKIAEIAKNCPFIVAGDFNLFPNLGGNETYKILTEIEPGDKTRPLIDAQTAARHPHHGPTGSWSGFKEAGQPGVKPDYIFIDSSIDVFMHGILADSFDGRFPSDHLPIVADLVLS